ncbi:MAG: thioredoxin domain-containing protein [Leptolyngbya sp. SIO4C1]|nr:thioredoxin domain-containing protein [Leptolyngbya sp. SIO4C1]
MKRFTQPWLVLAAVLWLSAAGCSGRVTDTAEAPPETLPETSAEAQAEARARWEAQQQRVSEVLSDRTRAELVGNSPTKGSSEADVVLFKFSDFQCPYCAVAAGEMKTFMDGREDVLYVYKHFPLNSIHPEATPAAKAAWAAQQQDQFWIYHNGLFANQDRLGEALYVELAEQIGLDMEKFNRDRSSDTAAAAVQTDLELAEALQLGGTPTFLMNDLLIPAGAPIEFFEEATARLKAYSEQSP